MKTLYKYVSDPSLLMKERYIRATQLSALNDPFEANYCSDGLKSLGQELEYSHGYDSDLSQFIDQSKHKVGVICLTESRENLLMWSHYANEHKGCVVGFTINSSLNEKFFNFFEHLHPWENHSIQPSPYNGLFEPVKYRKQPRYRIDSFDYDYSNFQEHQILHEIFQIKSDEWIYEKEHRAILQLSQADRIIIPNEIFITDTRRHRTIELANENNCYEFKGNSHHFYLDQITDENIGYRIIIGESLFDFSYFNSSLYLFKISRSAFKSITYGYNSNFIEQDESFNEYCPSRFFERWKTNLSTSHYTLNFNELSSE